MRFMNFRTAVSCCACCLFACSMTANAQEFNLNLSSFAGSTGAVGLNVDAIDDQDALFMATPNTDGITTSNVLINPITVDVAEEAGTLELSIVNATATTGIDGFEGNNTASLNVTGIGLSLQGPAQRIVPTVSAANVGAGVPESGFRLDATHEEFLTLAFNQDVIISAIGITDLSDGETFTFGSATDITNQDVGFVVGGFNSLGSGTIDSFTFANPLEIAAGEEILVGNTGFDPNVLSTANAGVGFEIITLEVVGGSPTAAIPEPSSLAVLGLGGLLIAARRRRG